MKYVITGAAGNVSKPMAQRLLQAGHTVTIIGRDAGHLNELRLQGAHIAIGAVEDVEFLKETFSGADAAYTMCPPDISVKSPKDYGGRIRYPI